MGKIAFVFAGQGAQSPGMGKDLYDHYDVVKRIFDMAGEKLKSLSFYGSAKALNVTIHAQPCLFAMGMACAAVLNENGIFADGVAGFSLGEIPAVAYSGIMSEAPAFDFVCFRAQVMHDCSQQNKGEMFAIVRLSANEVENVCTSLSNAYPVNYNCEGQTVVACSIESSEALQKAVAAQGGKAIKLTVSGAFHSPFMDEASDKITKYLENKEMSIMRVPIYANVTAQLYDDPKALLSQQVNHPVLWQRTIENMIADGFDVFIETGAGKTLSGLIKKINRNVTVLNVCDLASLENTLSYSKSMEYRR